MKYLAAIVVLAFVMILATPALAQRDANSAGARAAYGAPGFNSGALKKNKKAQKKKKRKTRKKTKTRDPKTAEERRKSLHF